MGRCGHGGDPPPHRLQQRPARQRDGQGCRRQRGNGSGGRVLLLLGLQDRHQHKYRNYDLRLFGNRVHDNNGYGINVEMWDNEGITSRIWENDVWGNGKSLDVDTHSLWVGNSFGVVIDRNYVHDNYLRVGASSGSGVGIFVDYNGVSPAGGANCVIRDNVVCRQSRLASTAITPSAGIMVLANTNTLVEANVVYDCRQGIVIGPALTDQTKVYSNAVINVDQFGICNHGSGTTNSDVKDNIVSGASVGIFAASTGAAGFAESYNDVHSCTTPRANGVYSAPSGTSLDGTDITSDPLFIDRNNPTLGLRDDSPCWRAGAFLAHGKVGFRGRPFQIPVDIGPFPRSQLTRAA